MKRNRTLGGVLLLALTLVVYVPVMRGGFLWDDDVLITTNRWVTGTGGLPGIWAGISGPDYIPVTSTLFWAEWRLFGIHASGYHVVNILLHAGAVLLFWRLLARLKIRGAWIAAALFAVHPVAVGSVAWIAEGKNTLALVFALLSFHFYTSSEAGGSERRRFYLLALASFIAALLSKSAVVMLPCVLLLCHWWKNQRIGRAELLRLGPFFMASLVDGLITIWFQTKRAIGGAQIPIGDPFDRLKAAAFAIWFYLLKALVPVHLSIIYPSSSGATGWLEAGLGALSAVVLLAFAWKARAAWARGFVFGFGSFVLLLLPVLGFIKMYYFIFAPVADHLEYIALPILIATIVGGADHFFPATGLRLPKTMASGLIIMLFGWLTWTQASIYADSRGFWACAAQRSPQCFAVHFGLGNELANSGDIDGAIGEYQLACQLNPGFLKARMDLAISLCQKGRLEDAAREYRAAIKLRPEFADGHQGLGIVLYRQGNFDEAIGEYDQALTIDPGNAETHNDLGAALKAAGKIADATVEFSKAVDLNPGYADARMNLGLALFSAGDARDSVVQFEKLTGLRPNSTDVHNDLGSALYMAGRTEEAIAEYREALRLDPGSSSARQNLDGALRRAGR